MQAAIITTYNDRSYFEIGTLKSTIIESGPSFLCQRHRGEGDTNTVETPQIVELNILVIGSEYHLELRLCKRWESIKLNDTVY